MKRTITPETLEAAKQYIRITHYKLDQSLPEGFDLEGSARKLFAAPDSPEKRHFVRFVRNTTKRDIAHKAATEAGLYDIYGLYSALCDLSEHIMHDQGETGYRPPPIFMTSPQARRSASDIIAVIKRTTGFDLMDPVGSLRRLQRRKAVIA